MPYYAPERTNPKPGGVRRKLMSNPSLVCVASLAKPKPKGDGTEPEDSSPLIKERSLKAGQLTVRYTRIAAHVVGISAEACRRQARRLRGSGRTSESVAGTSGKAADLPETQSGIRKLFDKDEALPVSPEILAKMAATLRAADSVIAGPLSDDDHSMPGLLPHLAELAENAFRALRPPPPLIRHISFAQVARKFQYVQMTREEARRLAAGASDLGILAQMFRRLYGDTGEFAITSFSRTGLLWAEGQEWEIEPIANEETDDARAADAFCTAWVVARQFQRASVSKALASARKAAGAAIGGR